MCVHFLHQVIHERQIYCPHPILVGHVNYINGHVLMDGPCVSSLHSLAASISNLPVSCTALSKSAFYTSMLALSCCSWTIVVVASLAEVTLFGQ